jgi:peptidylprolyl isomerase
MTKKRKKTGIQKDRLAKSIGNKSTSVKTYSPKGVYKVGQEIYHSSFEDTGKIINKKEGTDKVQMLVVDFPKVGRKVLIEHKQVRKVRKGDRIRFHFTSHLSNGTIIHSLQSVSPKKLQLGEGLWFDYVENQMIGMVEGEEKSICVPPEEAYGEYRQDLVFAVDRDHIQIENPHVGHYYKKQLKDGQFMKVRCIHLDKETVTLDGNHRLAGQKIIFDVKLLEIME